MKLSGSKVICESCDEVYAGSAFFCPNCGVERKRAREPIDPLIGTTVAERYHLIERTSENLTGVVYRAEHVMLRKSVALKILHLELSQDELAIERFRREATTVGELDNEHIVEIHDFGRMQDGRLYLAMEYLDGETLQSLFHREMGLDIGRVVHILTQLGEALMEAHAMGYIHRDLRPGNIMLCTKRSRTDFVKLLDFGLAKLVEREGEAASTSLGMTFGDPHYMSPEQAKGNPIDRRADIYSMGCIAYQMLAGHPPFHGGKIFDVLMRQVEEVPADVQTFRADVPDWLARVVMRCLEKDPEERFVTVYRLVQALRQGSDSGAIMSDELARRPSTVQPPSVERAIEKLGKRAPSSGPAFVHAAQESEEGAVRQSIPHELSDQLEAPSGAVEDAAGKRSHHIDASASRNASISAAWYADGEHLEMGEPAVLDEQAKARLAEARARRYSESHHDEYAEEPSRLIYYLGAALLLCASLLTWALMNRDASEVAEGVDSQADAIEENAAQASPESEQVLAEPAEEVVETKPETVAVRNELEEALPEEIEPLEEIVEVAPPPKSEPAKSEAPANADEVVRAEPAKKSKESPTKTPVAPKVAASKKPEEVKRPKPAEAKTKEQATEVNKPAAPQPADSSPPKVAVSPSAKESEVQQPAESDRAESDQPTAAAASESLTFSKRGREELRQGDVLAAASSFRNAKDLNPANADAHLGLGEVALSQGSFDGAVTHLTRTTSLKPANWRAWMLLGEAQLSAGETRAAEEAFKNSLKLNPDNDRARDGYNQSIGLE